jgi:hypothetical protein
VGTVGKSNSSPPQRWVAAECVQRTYPLEIIPQISLYYVSQLRYIKSMSNPISFRLSDTAIGLLESLCSGLGLKRSGVLELALRELAKKHKVAGVPLS